MDFWWQIFFHIFPRKNGLKFVTPQTSKNFTTFSTARKETYHLELALGLRSRGPGKELKNPWNPKITKKIRKKYKTPVPGWGPKNTKKKYRKNTRVVIFMTTFVVLRYFFVFLGPHPGTIFSYFFRNFWVSGVLGSLPGPRDRNSGGDFQVINRSPTRGLVHSCTKPWGIQGEPCRCLLPDLQARQAMPLSPQWGVAITLKSPEELWKPSISQLNG